MVFSAGLATKRKKSLSAVVRAVRAGLHDVDHFRLIRVNVDFAEVSAAEDARVGRRFMPGCAAILRSEQPLIHNGQHASPAGSRNYRDSDAAASFFGQTGSGNNR